MHAIRMLLPLAMATGVVASAEAQKTHRIGIQVDRAKELYQFTPAQVTAAPGDTLLFRVVNGAPHNISFEANKLAPAARTALAAALGHRSGELSSPMLTKDGTEYRLVLPNLPLGTYDYFCLPHRAYDMRGQIIVKKR